MKNIFKLTLICLSIGIFFSSCTSKILVNKRVHSDGYYISYNNGKSNIEQAKNKKVDLPSTTEDNEFESQKQDMQIAIEPTIASEENNKSHDISVFDREIIVDKAFKEFIQQKVSNSEKSIRRSISPFNHTIGSEVLSANDTNETYSLLWILVIILLFLWLLGYLAGGLGLGGLINILLVIALILFILWLLRVV
jgi:hypothetical protein